MRSEEQSVPVMPELEGDMTDSGPAKTSVIEVRDVDVSFNDIAAVQSLSLTVAEGERIALLGRTGAGKSTLLNLLIGALAPTSGTVRVAGYDPLADYHEMQGRFSIAFQSPRLLPWRTALKNVTLGLEILKIDRAERERRGVEWLERVDLAGAEHKFPAQLSGGMRQRVSLARAFAIDPDVMYLDESFSALDEVTAASLRADFLELCEVTNLTCVIVTHNIREAFELGHRVIVLGSPARKLAVFDTSLVDLGDATQWSRVHRAILRTMDTNEPIDVADVI